MKGLAALAERAIKLGYQTVGAESRAKKRAVEVAPFFQKLFAKIASASGGIRGQKDVASPGYRATVKIGNVKLELQNGELTNHESDKNIGQFFRAIKTVLQHHIRALENDLKEARERRKDADDAYYTVRALLAVLDAKGVSPQRKEAVVVQAFKDASFRDAMDAAKDVSAEAVDKFVQDQTEVAQ